MPPILPSISNLRYVLAGGIVEDIIDVFDFVTILVFVGSAYPRYSGWAYDLAHTIASIFRSGFSWV